MSELEPLLTTEDVARYLNVEVTTVRRLISRGELGAYKIGGEYRFSSRDVREYLERQHVPARAPQLLLPARADMLLRRGAPLVRLLGGAVPQANFAAFTKRAKQVLQLAAGESEARQDAYVGTEHLLLGLALERDALAGSVLAMLGITHSRAQAAIADVVAPQKRAPDAGGVALSENAKAAITRAIAIAPELGHRYIGTEHLLLALVEQADSAAVRALEQLGPTVEQVRTTVHLMLEAGGRR